MTGGRKKPEEWDAQLKDCITQGLNFVETNKRLKASLGEEGSVSKAAYQNHKKDLTGGIEADKALGDIKERMTGEKPKAKPRPAWSPQKQKAADTSKLAELMNKGIYQGVMPFCKSKELKEADVKDINPGGAIVGLIQWAAPGLNLDHPVIVLVTRAIMFYIAFKRICATAQAKIESVKEKLAGTVESGTTESMGGLKPEFVEMTK